MAISVDLRELAAHGIGQAVQPVGQEIFERKNVVGHGAAVDSYKINHYKSDE